jgi:hypothetical protein
MDGNCARRGLVADENDFALIERGRDEKGLAPRKAQTRNTIMRSKPAGVGRTWLPSVAPTNPISRWSQRRAKEIYHISFDGGC